MKNILVVLIVSGILIGLSACEKSVASCDSYPLQLNDTISTDLDGPNFSVAYELDLDNNNTSDLIFRSHKSLTSMGGDCSITIRALNSSWSIIANDTAVFVCQDTLVNISYTRYDSYNCTSQDNYISTDTIKVPTLVNENEFNNLPTEESSNQTLKIYDINGNGYLQSPNYFSPRIITGALGQEKKEGIIAIVNSDNEVFAVRIELETTGCPDLYVHEILKIDCE